MDIASAGIDPGKAAFTSSHSTHQGKVVVRRKFWRKQRLARTANLPNSLIGAEAYSGADFLGAALRAAFQSHSLHQSHCHLFNCCSVFFWAAPGIDGDHCDLARLGVGERRK